MTSLALKHLEKQAVYWINLSRSTERYHHWMSTVRPLFREATRVKATDGATEITDDEARRFVDGWNITWNMYIHELTAANRPQSQTGFRMSTAKMNVAIRHSHLTALRLGLHHEPAHERFMISEDDIAPRGSLWREDIGPPPPWADVAIWSGGLAMAAVRTDDKLYESGASFRWVDVTPTQAFNTLGAGLYEVTRPAAEKIIDAVETWSMPFDHAWGFALRNMRVYRLKPNGFAQEGPSIRNGTTRIPVTDREMMT